MDILGFQEKQKTVKMETSRYNDIPNSQNRRIDQKSIDYEIGLKAKFGLREDFQGSETSVYNCHGLTFASKRTGIFDDAVIEQILRDEYNEINVANVIIGDIALYFSYNDKKEKIFEHSAIVVHIGSLAGLESLGIRVLSKTRFYKEIVHYVQNHPYSGAEYKFYRIKHEAITIL